MLLLLLGYYHYYCCYYICCVDDAATAAVGRQSVLSLPEQLCSAETRSLSGFVDLMQLCDGADSLGRRLITAVKSLAHSVDTATVSAKCELNCRAGFYPHDAMLERLLATALCLCLSVTSQCSVETVEQIVLTLELPSAYPALYLKEILDLQKSEYLPLELCSKLPT